MNGYFAGKPIVLTSEEITKEGKEVFAYYGLKIVDYEISHGIKRSSRESYLYSASMHISCSALDNAAGGDLSSDTYEFQTVLEITPERASGFSTTNIALTNNDFSSNKRSFNIIIRYLYQGDHWIYAGMAGGGPSKSFLHDLETFPQNKAFRQAVGMEG